MNPHSPSYTLQNLFSFAFLIVLIGHQAQINRFCHVLDSLLFYNTGHGRAIKNNTLIHFAFFVFSGENSRCGLSEDPRTLAGSLSRSRIHEAQDAHQKSNNFFPLNNLFILSHGDATIFQSSVVYTIFRNTKSVKEVVVSVQ